MDNLESSENEILTANTLQKIIDERTYNYCEDEKVLGKRLSEILARIYFATYKRKIDRIFNQMKSE
jgi:hypothetical protein